MLGNVTAADGKTFSYDSQNELVTMNGGAVQIMYDGDGNRVAKSVPSGGVTTTTYFLVDDLNPTGLPQVMDELTNGVVMRTYTYGLQRIDEDQTVNGAWTPSFYSYDGMGSVCGGRKCGFCSRIVPLALRPRSMGIRGEQRTSRAAPP